MPRFSLFISGLVIMLASCSPRLSPLTEQLREQNNWSEETLSKIQFYLSEDLVLSRQATKGRTDITQGRVRVENGREIEEVIFEKGTPGVVLFSPAKDNLAIGFDGRDDSKFLVFGPNPKLSGKYTLLAKDWQRYKGKVSYAGKTWDVSASSADVNLLLDMRKRGSTKYDSERAAGRRVN